MDGLLTCVLHKLEGRRDATPLHDKSTQYNTGPTTTKIRQDCPKYIQLI